VILIADIEFILMLAKEGLFNNIIICGRDDDKKFKERASLDVEYFRNKGNI
jgi:hypothetical protein